MKVLAPVGGILVVVFFVSAWCLNIYKFVSADFEAPYKTEVIRGIGIPFGPLGVITGYMDIGDE